MWSYKWGATMQCSKAILALSCVSAVAASVFVASGAMATVEPNSIELEDLRLSTAASGMILAALEPTVIDSKDAETERPVNRLVPVPNNRIPLSSNNTVVGTASFYYDPQKTASGEQYDPDAYTVAAQLEIRDKFGGIKYGRLYQPAYAVGEYGGKKIIVRFNDVGPLRPGRKFDLSRATMAYFDATLEKGLLPDFRMTPLPLGKTYPTGPVTDEQLVALGIGDGEFRIVTADAADTQEPSPVETEATIAKQPAPVDEKIDSSFDTSYELRDWRRAPEDNVTSDPA